MDEQELAEIESRWARAAGCWILLVNPHDAHGEASAARALEQVTVDEFTSAAEDVRRLVAAVRELREALDTERELE